MKRCFAVSAVLLGALGSAQAGTVNIGYVNSNPGVGTVGNYGIIGIAPASGSGGVIAPCTGYIPSKANGCATPVPNDAFDTGKSSYVATLFEGATLSQAPPTASSTTPLTVYANNNPGVTFALMGANAPGTQNFWINQDQTNGDYVYVPINQFGASSVYTMLNDMVGSAVQVTFDFNTVANGDTLVGDTTVVLDLTDGTNIRSGLLCTTGTCPTGAGSTPSALYATGLSAGASGSAVTATGTALTPGSTINVSTGSVCLTPGANCTPWSAAYSAVPAGTPFTGTTGTATLDYQNFQFGSLFANDWLVGLQVEELPTTGPNSSNNFFALSAVSVTTPEPSTVMLSLTGLIAIGIGLVRRKRVA
jgi:hypothetical protein